MRIEQDFTVRRPPAEVFAYMTDPANLKSWQPTKLLGRAADRRPAAPGLPAQGADEDRPAHLGPGRRVHRVRARPGADHARVGRPSMPVDGRWTLADDGAGGTPPPLRRLGRPERRDAAAGAGPEARHRPQLPAVPRAAGAERRGALVGDAGARAADRLGDLGAGGDAELGEHVGEVALDRLLGRGTARRRSRGSCGPSATRSAISRSRPLSAAEARRRRRRGAGARSRRTPSRRSSRAASSRRRCGAAAPRARPPRA